MNQPAPLAPALVTLALVVSVTAGLVSLILEPFGVLINLLSALVTVGPSALISALVVSRYRSRRDKRNDAVLVYVCMREFNNLKLLTEKVISILYGGREVSSSDSPKSRVMSTKTQYPLDSLIATFEELQHRFESAADNSTLDRTDEKPWIADDVLFQIPDFPLIARSIESLSSRHEAPWASYMANVASRWYETAPYQLTIHSHGRAITQIAVGTVNAQAQAYVQREAGSGPIVVEPANYLPIIGQALHKTIVILTHFKNEKVLQDDYLRFIIEMDEFHFNL